MIYFITSDALKAVKVGYSNKSAERRLSELQVSMPFKLEILRVVEGDRSIEKKCHRALAHVRVSGEWFEKAAALAFMAECSALGANRAASLRLATKEAEAKRLREQRQKVSSLTAAIIDRALTQHGMSAVCLAMGCDPSSVGNWRRGKLPETHRVLNLLTLDRHLLDDLFAHYGCAIVDEADTLKTGLRSVA